MITSQELTDALAAAGIPRDRIRLFDESYVTATERWITDDLGKAIDDFYFRADIFYSDAFDCNHFAKAATVVADWCLAKQQGADAQAALALGLFGYLTGESGHMINVSVHKETMDNDQDELVVRFWEPQPQRPAGAEVFSRNSMRTMKPVTLTQTEIQSCVTCLFV